MITETIAKFQRELNSYQGLAILNIVFGGLAMSFGIGIGIQNIFALVQAQNLLLPQLFLIALGFLATVISMKWLVSSAELLESVTDMKDDYSKKKTGLDEENLTGLIINMIANYRENKPIIKAMMLISKIAGVCFLISGVFNLAIVVTNIIAGASTWELLVQALGPVFSFAMATACLVIPHFFGKYSKIWDYRLEETVKAEKEFGRQLKED